MVQNKKHTKVAMMSTGGANKATYGRKKSRYTIRCTIDVHMVLSYPVMDLRKGFLTSFD